MHFSIRPVREADRETFLTMSREFYGSDAVLHPIPEAYHTATFEELIGSERYLKCLLFEAEGVSLEVAKEAMRLAANKLPVATKFVVRRDYVE